MSQGKLKPDLRLVAAENIHFHEHAQHRRTLKLKERIRQEALLRNPPIVAELGDAKYLLLDGANRVSSMRDLHYPLVPVQVVDYGNPAIQLKGWHHLLIQGPSLNLHDAFSALPGVGMSPISTDEIGRRLELREVFAIFVDENTKCWGLQPDNGAPLTDSFHRIEVLDLIVGCYEGQSDLERIKLAEFSSLPEAIRSLQHQLCLFPVLTKEELVELARAQIMIPTGITRHLIPGRALGLNLDLHFLTDGSSLEAKHAHFQAYLNTLDVGGRLRFYEESVFIMNE